MSKQKKPHPPVKSRLHPRNRHRERYDLKELVKSCPELSEFVKLNEYDDETINFFDPAAVKMLNKALLVHHYDLEQWDIPEGYLCPPIPGRADYLHYVADLLAGIDEENLDKPIPKGKEIKCLDIGLGANCVYPIVGHKEYGWSFVGTETDPVAMKAAKAIIDGNSVLKDDVELRFQDDPRDYFNSIIQDGERFDLTICNPPFHTSAEEAKAATVRKLRNLKKEFVIKPVLNFGGQPTELWCTGGEEKFVREMIFESEKYGKSVKWFTTLIAQKRHLQGLYKALRKAKAKEVKTIPMGQGNKVSRILAWRF